MGWMNFFVSVITVANKNPFIQQNVWCFTSFAVYRKGLGHHVWNFCHSSPYAPRAELAGGVTDTGGESECPSFGAEGTSWTLQHKPLTVHNIRKKWTLYTQSRFRVISYWTIWKWPRTYPSGARIKATMLFIILVQLHIRIRCWNSVPSPLIRLASRSQSAHLWAGSNLQCKWYHSDMAWPRPGDFHAQLSEVGFRRDSAVGRNDG
jgi:hypothetical protein